LFDTRFPVSEVLLESHPLSEEVPVKLVFSRNSLSTNARKTSFLVIAKDSTVVGYFLQRKVETNSEFVLLYDLNLKTKSFGVGKPTAKESLGDSLVFDKLKIALANEDSICQLCHHNHESSMEAKEYSNV
jgi:hypothetical protein